MALKSPSSRAIRYAALASPIALISLGIVVRFTAGRWEGATFWVVLGWALMSCISVAGGSWLAALHGTRGSGFVVAMGASMLCRLFAAGAGGAGAVLAGKQALWAYISGLAAGFVPLQVFEMAWFKRMAGRVSARTRS